MISIATLSKDELRGKRVLLRADLNVPVEHGHVMDTFRIMRVMNTIRHIREAGARLIIIAHIGRDPSETLRPVYESVKAHSRGLVFVPEPLGVVVEHAVEMMKDGDAILLENLRRYPGEEANDPAFVKQLAELADIYVDDAFSAAHREHASIVGVPALLPHYAGLLLAEEVEHLSIALRPPTPALCILGGAKFETKQPLVRTLLTKYGTVFIGGAIANDILKAKSLSVGASLVGDEAPAADVLSHPGLLYPTDLVVERHDGQAVRRVAHEVQSDEKIVDIGPDSVASIVPFVNKAQFILWNGPMGKYEDGFDAATEGIADLLSKSSARTVVGGGDTVAAISKKGLEDKFWFLSTGGGAMLEFLLNGTLPGIQALE